ncbi:MAG: TauD/TfdA family dioxygenase [Pseudomonadota bacterium]
MNELKSGQELSNLQSTWDSRLESQLQQLRIEVNPAQAGNYRDPIQSRLKQYGFALVHGIGFNAERAQIASRLIDLSNSLGEILPQSPRAEAIEDIKDYSDIDERDDRGYRSGGELSPHSDPPTIILLHCLQPARYGGESHIVNVKAIYQKMVSLDADLTQLLFNGFPFWQVAGHADLSEGGPATRARPVFALDQGLLSCVIYRPYIEKAANALGKPLSQSETAALDLFETCANDPALSLRFTLRPGETLLLHNRTVLHARTDFKDWPELERRRHLLRAWIDAPKLLPVSPCHELGDIFQGGIQLSPISYPESTSGS